MSGKARESANPMAMHAMETCRLIMMEPARIQQNYHAHDTERGKEISLEMELHTGKPWLSLLRMES